MTRDQAIRRIMDAFEALHDQVEDSWPAHEKVEDDCIAALLAMGATHDEMLAVAEQAMREEAAR